MVCCRFHRASPPIPREGGRARARGFGLVLALVLGLGPVLQAASSVENRAYEVALRLFERAAYDLAERDLTNFFLAFPTSERLPEATLLLAQARFQQGRYERALEQLRERLPSAGALADQYHFWIAESLFRLGRFGEASEAYGVVLSGFPTSGRRLESAVGQAYALMQSSHAREAFALLAAPSGPFLPEAARSPSSEVAVRGHLLIGESALASGEFAAGETLLSQLPAAGLPPELWWQREYLLARLQAAGQRWEPALATASNLVAQLTPLTNAAALSFRSDATALLGEILEQTGNSPGAIRAFEANLAAGTAASRRQEAAARIARLTLATRSNEAAAASLESLLARHGGDPVLDPLRLALAEVQVRRYFTLADEARATGFALLQQARQQATAVLTNGGAGVVARAQFAIGWCAWEEGKAGALPERIQESLAAFEAAATGLPRSLEQAVARFKAGDCRFLLTNYTAALADYWAAATNYTDLAGVRDGMADLALYQVVRCGIQTKDLDAANRAMAAVLEWYPRSYYGDRSVLLYGQALGRVGRPAEARRLFQDYLARFPESTLAPMVRLALARTWQQEGDWAAAAAEYERWLAAYGGHPLRGDAEYERAQSTHRTGNEAAAFQQYTNFLAVFPDHPLAPAAQFWVARHYYNREQYDLAELEFQKVFQNRRWPASDLSFHARMMAGRSAFRRTSYREARNYFTALLNTNCPPELLPDAFFELGNTIRLGADATNTLASLGEAVEAYSRIPQNFPQSPLAPLAWGEIGNCQLQLASANPAAYDLAIVAYTNVMASADAGVTVRSMAEFGVATALEKKAAAGPPVERAALQAEALGHYLAITEGRLLREGETADLYWVERAASAGSHLAEDLQRWDVAEQLYRKLLELAPPLRQKYEARLERLRQLRAEAPGPGW